MLVRKPPDISIIIPIIVLVFFLLAAVYVYYKVLKEGAEKKDIEASDKLPKEK